MTETVSRANAKAASIVNVLREREACAKIARGTWATESNTLSPEYILRHRIAAEILAQPQDFKTMEEVLAEEGEKASDFIRGGKRDQFKGDVHHV